MKYGKRLVSKPITNYHCNYLKNLVSYKVILYMDGSTISFNELAMQFSHFNNRTLGLTYLANLP